MDRSFESELDKNTAQVKWWDIATSPTLDSVDPATGKIIDTPATFFLEPEQSGQATIAVNTDSGRWLQTQLGRRLDDFVVDVKHPEALNEAANRVISLDAVMDCYMVAAGQHTEITDSFTPAQRAFLSILEKTYHGDPAQLSLAAQQYAEATHFLSANTSQEPQPNLIDKAANQTALNQLIQFESDATGRWVTTPNTAQWKWAAEITHQNYQNVLSDPSQLRVVLQDVVGADTVLGGIHGKIKTVPEVVSLDDLFEAKSASGNNDRSLKTLSTWIEAVGFKPTL